MDSQQSAFRLNLPNAITLARFAVVPVFIALLLAKAPWATLTALLIFFLASLSDAIDGYLARRFSQVTVFGKFADPLADKLLLTAAWLAFVETGQLGAAVVMVLIGREFLVTGLRILAISQGTVLPAGFMGETENCGAHLASDRDFGWRLLGVVALHPRCQTDICMAFCCHIGCVWLILFLSLSNPFQSGAITIFMELWSFLTLAVVSGCAVGVVAVVAFSPVGNAISQRILKYQVPKETSSKQEELDALTTQILLMREELNELKAALPKQSSASDKI